MRFGCGICGLLLLLCMRVSAAAVVPGLPLAAGFVPPVMVLTNSADKASADKVGADKVGAVVLSADKFGAGYFAVLANTPRDVGIEQIAAAGSVWPRLDRLAAGRHN